MRKARCHKKPCPHDQETTRLAAIYTRKLAALEELKKALLHQAFSGEL
jgi:type I restriction enzyme S subunit